METTKVCTHLDQIRDVTPSALGCEECIKMGDTWVHLRECLECGHVGCCDSSKNQTRHKALQRYRASHSRFFRARGGLALLLHRRGDCLSETDTLAGTPALRLVGRRSSPEAYGIRDFLTRNRIEYEWVDTESEEVSLDVLAKERIEDPTLPVCVLPDGTHLEAPSLREIAGALGLMSEPRLDRYDLAIVGAGPAGLAAAVYAASEGLSTAVIEREAPGGQAGSSSRIENYLGFPEGISGSELAGRAREQAERFGAEFLLVREVVGGGEEEGMHVSHFSDGTRGPLAGGDLRQRRRVAPAPRRGDRRVGGSRRVLRGGYQRGAGHKGRGGSW